MHAAAGRLSSGGIGAGFRTSIPSAPHTCGMPVLCHAASASRPVGLLLHTLRCSYCFKAHEAAATPRARSTHRPARFLVPRPVPHRRRTRHLFLLPNPSILPAPPFVSQVALLFRNHDDLLREFTYFLPDNTPPLAGGARGGARGPLPGKKSVGGYKAGRKAPPPLRKGGWGWVPGGQGGRVFALADDAGRPWPAAPGQCLQRLGSAQRADSPGRRPRPSPPQTTPRSRASCSSSSA